MSAPPSVGRIVHLLSPTPEGLEPVAAIITKLGDVEGSAYLTVFLPDQLPGYTRGPIPFAEEPTVGHWSWPSQK